MTKKTAAQLDADIAAALRKDPSAVVGALRAAHTTHGGKVVQCKRCKGKGYIYTTRQEACPVCDKLGKVMAHATKKTGIYVGAELRDDLIEDIDALEWDGTDTDGVPFTERAQKIMTALREAAPQRKGFVFDDEGWAWQDYDFLKTALQSVKENMDNIATSRGISLGGSLIGRQIHALREKL